MKEINLNFSFGSFKNKVHHYKNIQFTNLKIPTFISVHRSGHYWIRIMLELYFLRPVLLRTFFYDSYNDPNNFLLWHGHDPLLNVKSKSVIFLYRKDISAVIFSVLKMHSKFRADKHFEEIGKQEIQLCKKYLLKSPHINIKTVVSYEDFIDHPKQQFLKICNHIEHNHVFNEERFDEICTKIDKKIVKQLVSKLKGSYMKASLNKQYSTERENFRKGYRDRIKKIIVRYGSEDMLNFLHV